MVNTYIHLQRCESSTTDELLIAQLATQMTFKHGLGHGDMPGYPWSTEDLPNCFVAFGYFWPEIVLILVLVTVCL